MPTAINLVVKNGATTPVDKTFTLMTPAAGDDSLARWFLREGSITSVFPSFTALARQTGNKSRQLRMKLHTPSSYTDAVTGLTQVGTGAEMNVTFSIPDTFPENLKDDFVAFSVNLLNHTLVKQMIRDAYAAT